MNSSVSSVNRQSGFALILVLWVLVLLTIMASSFSLTMRREISVATHVRDNAQATAYAQAGIAYAQLMLSHPDADKVWKADGGVYQIMFADAKIRIQIFEEAGKIDINFADEETLKNVFAGTAIAEERQIKIVNSILDWRDEDDLARPDGAEKDQYHKEGLKYQPPNKNFQIPEELLLVMGMDADIFKEVESMLTVYSGEKTVNPALASKQVLLSMQNVDAEQIDTFLSKRFEYGKNNEPLPEIDGLTDKNAGVSGVYTVIAEAFMPNEAKGRIKAVLKKTAKKKGLPFTILDWSYLYQDDQSLFSGINDSFLMN